MWGSRGEAPGFPNGTMVPIPVEVEIDRDFGLLCWYLGEEPKRKQPSSVTLRQFMELADLKGEVLEKRLCAFAKRWGVLMICFSHGLPAEHRIANPEHLEIQATGPRAILGCPVILHDGTEAQSDIVYSGVDPIESWRVFAKSAAAIVRLAAMANSATGGRIGTEQDWNEVFFGGFAEAENSFTHFGKRDRYGGQVAQDLKLSWAFYRNMFNNLAKSERASLPPQSRSRALKLLTQAVNLWLWIGNVRPVFEFSSIDSDPTPFWKFQIGSYGLFGSLAALLAGFVLVRDEFLICYYCGRFFEKNERTVAVTRKPCCHSIECEKARARMNQRRSRERKKQQISAKSPVRASKRGAARKKTRRQG